MELKAGLIALAVAAVVALVIARRLYGEPVRARRMLLVPVVELVFGGYQIAEHGGLPAGEWVSLTITGAISLAIGLARGATLQLFERRGYLWQRYRPRTFAVWAAAFVLRFAVRWVLSLTGTTHSTPVDVHALASGHGGFDKSLIGVLLITSGLGFLGESAVLAPRALGSGIPFAPPGTSRGGLLTGLLSELPRRSTDGHATHGGENGPSYPARGERPLSGLRRRR